MIFLRRRIFAHPNRRNASFFSAASSPEAQKSLQKGLGTALGIDFGIFEKYHHMSGTLPKLWFLSVESPFFYKRKIEDFSVNVFCALLMLAFFCFD